MAREMAADVSPDRQRSDGDYSTRVADKARRITVYLNGDRNFLGAQMLVNRRQIRTWEAFLNASTQKTGVMTAVRYIATPETGTHLADLEELRDKQSYVAITRGKFKPIGYTTLSERRKLYLEGNVHRTSSILKIKPVEHSHIQVPGKIAKIPIRSVMINVFVNGKDFDAPYRIALSPKMMQSWRLVMKEIGEHIRGLVPKALYTVDGTRIITQPADLESNGKYVIVGNEPGGFLPYSYGVFSRAKPHKKLPPIKLKRKLSKKPTDREFSSSFQENPAEGSSEHAPQTAEHNIESKPPEITVLEVESSIERSLLTKPSTSTHKSSSFAQRTVSEKLENNVVLPHSSTTKAEKTKSAVEIEFQDSSVPASKESEQHVKGNSSETDLLDSDPIVEKLLSAKSLVGSPKVNLSVQRSNAENLDRDLSPSFKPSGHSRSTLMVIPELESKNERSSEVQQTAIPHEDPHHGYSVASVAVEEELISIQHEDTHQEYSVASVAVEEGLTAIHHEDTHRELEKKPSQKTTGSVSSHTARAIEKEKTGELDNNTTGTNVEGDRLSAKVTTVEKIGETEKVAEEEEVSEKEIKVEQTKRTKEENSNIGTDNEVITTSRTGLSPSRSASSEEELLSDDSASSKNKVWIKL